MGTISKPNNFSANTTISSSQVNANFDTIYNEFNGNIAAANLASNAVTTAKISDSNVTTAKIADSNVTTAKIADSNITTAKIADQAITYAKLGSTGTVRLGYGTGSGATLTTSYVDHASATATSHGGTIEIEWWAKVGNASSGATRNFDIQVLCDGATTGITPSTLNFEAIFVSGATTSLAYGFLHVQTGLAAGSHTWKLQFKASAGAAVILGTNSIRIAEVV